MSENQKTLIILNLAGKLSKELAVYFSSRKMTVIDPLVESTQYEWSHVLVKDVADFSVIDKTHQTIDKDVKMISLGKVEDLRNFVVYNGKLVFDEVWLKSAIGGFILDKFFQEYAGISIEDNYPNFIEKGSFKISNPFNTGEYLDRLVYHAFEAQYNALAIKTYFDHFLMYLTGLKKKGKVGLPIEVTYGNFNDIFGLQLHFFTNELSLDDVTLCLSSAITKKPEEYLFNISVQSTDFFDFTYIQGVNKVVVTALWSQDERIEMHNRGMMFTNLSSAATISEYPTDGASSYLLQNPNIEDMSDRISLPESALQEQELQTIAASFPETQVSQTIGGGADEQETITRVGGGKEDDFVTKVGGGSEKPDNFSMKISGGSDDDDKGNFNVKSLGGGLDNTQGNFNVKSLGGAGPDNTQGNFNVKSLGGTGPDNTQGNFNVKSLGGAGPDNTQGNFNVKSLGGAGPDNTQGNFNVKSLGGDSVSGLDSVQDDFALKVLGGGSLGGSDSLDLTSLVGPSPSKAGNLLFKSAPSEKEKEVELKLKAAVDENEKLKTKLKVMISEAKIAKDTQNRLDDFRNRAAAAGEVEEDVGADDASVMRQHFQQKLSDPKNMNLADMAKLKAFLEKETKLIDELKAGEMRAKKLQLELAQKDTFFGQELEKLQRQLVSKDIVLNKAKETFTNVSERANQEIASLKMRFDQVNKAFASGANQQQATTIRDLEKQNVNLNKMLEVYKNKITTLASSMQNTQEGDGDVKEEARRLSMLNVTFKNQLETTRKELQKLQDRTSSDNTALMTLKQDKVKLEQMVKKLTSEASRTIQVTAGPNLDNEIKKYQSQTQILEVQVKETTLKMRDLEKRLLEAQKAPKLQAQTGEDNSKAKVAHLETSMKKITSDLIASQNAMTEMKKETNKLRQEKTSLQNTVDKQKKDLEKYEKNKPAAPKVPGSGGKAA